VIITRAPFRVSFCGGGSDLANFYEQHGGCVLSTSIKKYMYLSIHPYFDPNTIALKYSQTEIVNNFDEIKHRIFRQCLTNFNIKGAELSSTADVPSGTGLGSSSTFTVALIHLLYTYIGRFVSKEQLAEEACEVEIKKLGEPIGKQDQYAAAYGGMNFIEFHRSGDVTVQPLVMKKESYEILEKRLLLFYTGNVHSASKILAEQSQNVKSTNKALIQLKMCSLARELKQNLEENNLSVMGECLHRSWLLKRELASGITSPEIDRLYEKAITAGAAGGKLLGAGGGGFLLFYVDEDKQASVREAMKELREMDFQFDNTGASIIFVGNR